MDEANGISTQNGEKRHDIELMKDAIDILFRFNMAFKIAKIYKPNNISFQRQIKTLFLSIQTVLQKDGDASLMLRQSTLFLNEVKVRFGFSNYGLFKFTNSEFQKRGIGILSFKSGLILEELNKFIILFIEKVEKSESPFEDFQDKLNQNSIAHIKIEKLSATDMIQSEEKNASKIFFLGITHLKETFEKMKKNEKTSLNITRRLMQAIFNHIINNESFTTGLTTIKNFDEYTLNHSVNVCILAVALGRRLGLDRNELADLGISAFLHDFGKTEIPKDILLKPGKLNEKEREIIEKHPHIGAEKLVHLKEMGYLPLRAIHVAMEHHVKEDLTGYPRYQKKRNINLYSKIVKICDFYDALTTERPYRTKNFTRDETLSMMIEKGGTEFDPIILKVFINMMGVYPVGTLVLLDSGELGIINEPNQEPGFLLRPKVKLITDSQRHKIDGDIVDLTDIDPYTQKHIRTIVKSLDPHKYSLNVSHYFLAQAQ